MSVVVFFFLALDWKDERKRCQLEKDLDMKLSKMDIAKSKIDDLRDSLEKLKDTVRYIPVSVVTAPDAIEKFPDGLITEYTTNDSFERDLSFEDVELTPESPAEMPEMPEAYSLTAPDSSDINAVFKNSQADGSSIMVKAFKRRFLQRPEDMFRTIEGEQIFVRRYHKNLLRKLVGISDDYNLTVSGYVDNILRCHFMFYKTEIDSLLTDKDKSDLNINSYEWT